MEPSIPILTLTKDLVHKQHQLKEAVSLAMEGDMDMSIVAKHSVIFPCHSSLLVLFSPLVARLLSEVPCCLSPTIFLPDFREIHITKLLHLLESGQAISDQNVNADIEIITEIAQVLQISVTDINTEPYLDNSLGNSFQIKKEANDFNVRALNETQETVSVIDKRCEEMEDYVYVEKEDTEKTPFVGTIKTEVADTVTSEVSIGMETNVEEDMIEIKNEVIDKEETSNSLDHNDRCKETEWVGGEVTVNTNVAVEQENKSRENCLGFISSVTSLAQKSVSSRSRRGSLLVLPTQGSKDNDSCKSDKENFDFDQKHMKVKIKKAESRNRFNFEENIHMEKDADRGEIDDDLELKKHMKTQAREKRHLCKYCKKRFKNLCHLKEHRMIHTGEKPFMCELCPKRFRKSSHLKEHTIIHTEEKPFPCELCPKQFKRSGQLKEHTMYHHTGDKKPFPCEVCPKMFTKASNLKVHTRTHTGEKPFQCQVCPKRFANSGHLKEHTRTHTGEKPFPCELCPKRFTRSSQLKEHTMYQHTGEKKPIPCEVCPKRFARPSFLKVHMRTHTGENPFQCEVCPKRFGQSSHLKEHTRSHTGEKPFQCQFCPKKYATSRTLKAHIKIHTEPKRNNSSE